jgi:RNA recognition motif-containing protein
VECKIAIPKEQINTISEANLDESSMSYRALKIFVGGLPPNLKESEMHNYFAKFGEIEQCVIMHDKPTGKSRGNFIIFAFLTF